uniref:Metallophosphoesterase MPPED2-like n=1 Tax=Hirondellea gigas TaxID=1518452 RepID=A0A2P2HYZ2_9CRUS
MADGGRENTVVEVHPLSTNPTDAWNVLRQQQRVIKLNVMPPKAPAAPNMLRFVCMSDTHSLTSRLTVNVPHGDVFIHAGDFTRCGTMEEVKEFNSWLGTLPHKYKIVIAGNHELSFDSNFNTIKNLCFRSSHTGYNLIDATPIMEAERISEQQHTSVDEGTSPELLTHATYLQDQLTAVAGVTVYGSPWQPEYMNSAFNLPRGAACLEKWEAIPAGVDVLLTHGPPLGHGDLTWRGIRAGCVELLNTVQNRVKPKYHVFGHIHEGYGITTDGKIIYINASTCDIHYAPRNPPLVFDVPIPSGYFK